MGPKGFFSQLWNSKFELLHGFYLTVGISFSAIAIGTMIGIFVGVLLTYGNLPVRFLARVYTDFIRGTPVLVLILGAFYILSVLGINLNTIQAGTFALTIFCSSHVAEMVRGALINVPRGQTEASKALGLSFLQTFTFVLMPQALRQILPTWINSSVETVKASTLVSIIGVGEIILTTQQIIARNFLTLPFYLFAGFLYFLVGFSIERLGKYAEKKVAIK